MSFTYLEPGRVVGSIIQNQLGLTGSQIMFTNEKWFLPTVGPAVFVSYLGPSRTIASTDICVPDGFGGLMEVQTVTSFDVIQIQILGYETASIRGYRTMIPAAFNSIYAQSIQEQYTMSISINPGPMIDASYLDSTAMVTRYITTVQATSINQFVPPPPQIYTDFSKAIPPQVLVNA
jgi:hypothetical protein